MIIQRIRERQRQRQRETGISITCSITVSNTFVGQIITTKIKVSRARQGTRVIVCFEAFTGVAVSNGTRYLRIDVNYL